MLKLNIYKILDSVSYFFERQDLRILESSIVFNIFPLFSMTLSPFLEDRALSPPYFP